MRLAPRQGRRTGRRRGVSWEVVSRERVVKRGRVATWDHTRRRLGWAGRWLVTSSTEAASEAELARLEAETVATKVLWVQVETTEGVRVVNEVATAAESGKVGTNLCAPGEIATTIYAHATRIDAHANAFGTFGTE